MSNAVSPNQEEVALTMLYDLLESGVASTTALSNTVRQFPDQASLLSDAVLLNSSPMIVPDEVAGQVERSVRSGIESRQPFAIKKLSTLVSARDYTRQKFVTQAGITASIFQKLDRRLITAATIPSLLVNRIADLLDETSERIEAYFYLPPLLPRGEFKNSAEQFTVKTETFVQAVNAANRLEAGYAELVKWLQ